MQFSPVLKTSPLKIRPLFQTSFLSEELLNYIQSVEETLKKLISVEIFEDALECKKWIDDSLPLIEWSYNSSCPDYIIIYLVCHHTTEINLIHFFQKILKTKLASEQEIEILSFQHLSFYLHHLQEIPLFMAEVKIHITEESLFFQLLRKLPLLAQSIKSDIQSRKSAKKFLEITDDSLEHKFHLIQDEITKVSKKFPFHFDPRITKKLNQLFAFTNDEFKKHRSHKHLSRIIISMYMLRQSLRGEIAMHGKKRHLQFRLVQTQLKFPFGSKNVFGIVVGISLFDKQEIFEEKHLVQSVQKFIPGSQSVINSFYLDHDEGDGIRVLYLEFEKKEESSFSIHDRTHLKNGLEEELKTRVEKWVPSVFMVRNEEEVMKNILILSRELDLLQDLPQVMINLDQQSSVYLQLMVILVRVTNEESKPLELLFEKLNSSCIFYFERCQVVGLIDEKNAKEANVFRVEIFLEPEFLRADFSVNFYLVRQKVISLIVEALGPVRDFNGGMIFKQGELLLQFKESFKDLNEKTPDLIENFFYSLSPIERQTTLPLSTLKSFFCLYHEAFKKNLKSIESYFYKTGEHPSCIFIVVKAKDRSLKKELQEIMEGHSRYRNFTTINKDFQDSFILSYLCPLEYCEPEEILEKIKGKINDWSLEVRNRQVLRLATSILPISLDPRIGGDEDSRNHLRQLFEGLMQIGRDGEPTFGVAESYSLSPERTTYTFYLKESRWSNGSPLVAYDFEYAWKKILQPDFETPFASFFYPIKNAKNAKQNLCSLDQVGIKSLDERTLKITLEKPTPYFLALVCLQIFSPISHHIDRIHPDWPFKDGDSYVCNGPFKLKKHILNYSYELEKNSHYWDADNVALDQINCSKMESHFIYKMFKKGALDWIGKSFASWDSSAINTSDDIIESRMSSKVNWCVFNTQKFPFNNVKIRQALSYAIDRKEMLELLGYNALAANSPLPFMHSQIASEGHELYDPIKAVKLFQEAMEELKLKAFPDFTCIFPKVAKFQEKIAHFLKKKWESLFGISCKLTTFEWTDQFAKLCEGDYSISLLFWTATVDDPFYTLNALKEREEKVNFPKWENTTYQSLLDKAEETSSKEERLKYLKEAESILIDEMPICPLFFEKNQNLKKSYVFIDEEIKTVYPDFKRVRILKK